MKVLIVEDDTFKLERITGCLRNLPKAINITIATSVQFAVATLASASFDFILLDMALPSHDLKPGGAPSSSMLSGGLEVIMELSFLLRRDNVIVITQYPEVEIEGDLIPIDNAEQVLNSICNISLTGVIHYDHETNDWETSLLKMLGQ
jgi:CheY-like chemotaxis protein